MFEWFCGTGAGRARQHRIQRLNRPECDTIQCERLFFKNRKISSQILFDYLNMRELYGYDEVKKQYLKT